MSEHTCSARTKERCPGCGHEDTRDAFECFAGFPGEALRFEVVCPKCEYRHPDQRNHDDPSCDACYDEELTGAHL